MPVERRWYLRTPDQARHGIGAGGVLLGRSARCEIVLTDPDVSRKQAVIYLAGDGPSLVVLGSARCSVDGVDVAGAARLDAGAQIEIAGGTFVLEAETVAPTTEAPWLLQRVGGGLFGLSRSPFSIGGGPDDDLRLDDLPPGAVVLHSGPGRLAAEARVAGVCCADAAGTETPLLQGELRKLGVGCVLGVGSHRIRVATGGDVSDKTTRAGHRAHAPMPVEVGLTFLPRGGRLTVTLRGDSVSVYLAGRRCDLVASLLRPRAPNNAGDFIPDPLLADMIWPQQGRGRIDINTLVYRLRKDLLRAGLDGCAVVQRETGGGATRFVLAAGAMVRVE